MPQLLLACFLFGRQLERLPPPPFVPLPPLLRRLLFSPKRPRNECNNTLSSSDDEDSFEQIHRDGLITKHPPSPSHPSPQFHAVSARILVARWLHCTDPSTTSQAHCDKTLTTQAPRLKVHDTGRETTAPHTASDTFSQLAMAFAVWNDVKLTVRGVRGRDRCGIWSSSICSATIMSVAV